MKVKTSKVFAKELQKELQAHGLSYACYQASLSPRAFRWNVDMDDYNHEQDYDYTTDTFKVIVVEYPYDYYACPRYITTKDLTRIFNNCADKTWGDFVKAFIEEIEI